MIFDWMFLADPGDLKQQLLSTVYHFHAFPPGMNILTGLLLKLSGGHVTAIAHGVFLICGLLMANSLLYCFRAVGLPVRWATTLAVTFSLTPQTLYFENLYLYDYPVPALLSFAAVLFHRAVAGNRFVGWLGLFAVCALLGWVRSALHLSWFVAIVALALLAVRGTRRRVLLAAVGPACVLLALYVKNLVVFGVFDSQSQSGGNAILITTYHLSQLERKQWVQEGKISPFAAMGFAAPPRAFIPHLGNPHSDQWPELSRLERPTLGSPNYNHWFYFEVNQRRRDDALTYLRDRPWAYVNTVWSVSLPQVFSPSTEWHPRNGKPGGPHWDHRAVLGGYERSYNWFIHDMFLSPVGWYALLPFVLGWAGVRGWRAVRRSTDDRSMGALLLLAVLHIVYLTAVSALLTCGENARYRYIVEPFIWILYAAAALALVKRLYERLSTLRRSDSSVRDRP